MEFDLAQEVRRVSASLLAFDRAAQTLTFRPTGATPVGIGADEQRVRNWLQAALLAADAVTTRALPHERAIEELVRRLQREHARGADPFGRYRRPDHASAAQAAQAAQDVQLVS